MQPRRPEKGYEVIKLKRSSSRLRVFVVAFSFRMPGAANQCDNAYRTTLTPSAYPLERELQEELLILAFALPRVADVGVVRHHDHHPAVLVGNHPEVRRAGCRSRAPGVPPLRPPEVDARDLMTSSKRNIVFRVGCPPGRPRSKIGERTVNLRRPLLPCPRAPEVVDPQKAALLQVLAQAPTSTRKPEGADIDRHRERAVEKLRRGAVTTQ